MTYQYLKVTVITHSGFKANNPLKMSEAYLIPPLSANNFKLEIECVEVSKREYKKIFGDGTT